MHFVSLALESSLAPASARFASRGWRMTGQPPRARTNLQSAEVSLKLESPGIRTDLLWTEEPLYFTLGLRGIV